MFLIDPDSHFKPGYFPAVQATEQDLLFIYQENKIGLTLENKLPLHHKSSTISYYCFGHINNQQCLLVEEAETHLLNFSETKLAHQWLPSAHYQAAAIGRQWYHWRKAHQYCGRCAARMQDKPEERARVCTQCHFIVYPKISPCVGVLVTRGEEMLLARSPHFLPGVMSVLAGFIEVGESAEQTIVREVKEEVGVEVAHIRYVRSQPWPFSDSLMLGFTAEYVRGDIVMQANEIEAAGWFHPNNLPILPHPISLSRYLIDQHLSRY